eukprot:200244-Rhodomonas_salina.1
MVEPPAPETPGPPSVGEGGGGDQGHASSGSDGEGDGSGEQLAVGPGEGSEGTCPSVDGTRTDSPQSQPLGKTGGDDDTQAGGA